MKKAILKLRDGKEFTGYVFGSNTSLVCGEVVFNTGIPGYQEILTDPSYEGQIVVLTSPMIGNYGIIPGDEESCGVKATALIIKKLYTGPVEEGREKLFSYMEKQNIIGLEGVDTRALTLYLRENGSQDGVIFFPEEREQAEKKLSSFPKIIERDLISEVAVKEIVKNPVFKNRVLPPKNSEKTFLVVDYGIKESIIEELYKRNVSVILAPPTIKSDEVLSFNPDALFLSNGPGDPALLKDAIKMTKDLIGKLPILGICLGHQIITHALGGKTMKMKFGHHGSNHPVKDKLTGKTFVTAQNHGFASDPTSLPKDVVVWYENANDGSIEGIFSNEKNVRSVQFHPEAAPGPEEAKSIFDEFIRWAK